MEEKIYKIISGKLSNINKMTIYISDPDLVSISNFMYMDYNKVNQLLSTKDIILTNYLNDISKIYNKYPILKGTKFLLLIGDIRDYDYYQNISILSIGQNIDKFPIISKTRSTEVDYLSLIMLNSPRHYDPIKNVQEYDIPYKEKKNCILWRGTTTGKTHIYNERFLLVSKYYSYDKSKINVGFSYICQKITLPEFEKYIVGEMSMKEMLTYKFLVSVEGNDVASGLKWMLSSNSVVIMPKPTCISIICENLLEPYVHYIPVKDDFSDLEDVYKWCLNNENKCFEIINNAKKYMSIFTDDFMLELSAKVIEEYGNRINIVVQNS